MGLFKEVTYVNNAFYVIQYINNGTAVVIACKIAGLGHRS
jgi:hypothetical protein